MDGRADENRFPSLDEFQGWYNLGYERPDGIPVLHSRKGVPGFEHAEFFDLYVAENQWFENLVPQAALKPFDPLSEPPMFVKSDADDRTLDVCPNFDHLTLELIHRIQKEFLGRHPLWRVVLAADDPSCCIVIYPRVIRFGNLPLGVDPENAMRELVPRAIAARETRLRPKRAQVEFLQQRLPDAVRDIGDRPFFVVGVLDNDEGDYNRLVIFLLLQGDRRHAIDLDGPPGVDNDFLWSAGGFDVDSDGHFVSDSSISNPAAFHVALWCPPAGYRGALTITDREAGKTYIFELKSGDITHTFPTNFQPNRPARRSDKRSG